MSSSITQSAFNSTNAKGQQAERDVIGLICEAGGTASINNKTHMGHCDIIAVVGGRPFRLEVKNENAYKHSPNLCVEQYQGRKEDGGEVQASGVTITEACVMIHTMGRNAILYLTPQMRNWMRENRHNYPFRSFGDNGNGGTLVPIARLRGLWWFDELPMTKLMASKIWQL